ncbi:MAG: type 4a pilus biogenesis protein PilO [Clostridia bacterium]|nr:type 4a pilus biogenesis protein PilO [Clostridia bacterium]
MNKKLSTNIILLVLSGLIVILLITLSILKFTHMKETNAAIESEYTYLDQNSSQLSRFKKLEKIKNQLESTINILEQQIPSNPDEYKIIDQIQQVSLDSVADFVQIQFSDRVQNNGINEMPFKLTFTGKYTSLIKLLNSLAEGERLIRIDDIQIAKGDNAMSSIRADISAVAFSK